MSIYPTKKEKSFLTPKHLQLQLRLPQHSKEKKNSLISDDTAKSKVWELKSEGSMVEWSMHWTRNMVVHGSESHFGHLLELFLVVSNSNPPPLLLANWLPPASSGFLSCYLDYFFYFFLFKQSTCKLAGRAECIFHY